MRPGLVERDRRAGGERRFDEQADPGRRGHRRATIAASFAEGALARARLARLHAPEGFLLLMWPCWWAAALATPGPGADVRLLALFCAGALLARAAGCVWNDIVDRDIDAKVARTRDRPIASGRVSVRGAAVFMALLAGGALAVLAQLPPAAIAVGLASLALVLPYPFMKRVTWWPQAWLGLTFAWGAPLGWAAATGGLDGAALALYAGAIAWTIGYDIIYAHQDRVDDARAGVRSAARRLGARTAAALWLFYAAGLAGLAAAASLAGAGWPAFAGLAAAAPVLAWQAATLDIDDPAGCRARFRANNLFAAVAFLGFLAA